MQKKLIALAIAGAFVAPAAALADSGNVTIYGVMDTSFDIIDSGDGNTVTASGARGTVTAQGVRQNAVSGNSSRIGFKGSEDLGNGLAAVWQVETAINSDGGATTGWAGRNTFVGLSGKSWGTAILGRHDTPYKLATRSLDVFGDGIADNRSIMGGGVGTVATAGVRGGAAGMAAASFDGRQSNVLAYISPTWNGFHAAVAYVTFENAIDIPNTAASNTQTQDHAWSLAGIYGNGPWFASLAYERHDIENTLNASGAEEHAWKLGVGYKANNFRVGMAYETTDDNFGVGGANALGHNAWYLGGGYTFGNNEVKLAYTHANDADALTNSGAKQWAVGLDHNFSKRTKVYALYTKLDNDNNGMYTLSGGSTSAGLGNAIGGYGSDPSAWSFGIRHNF